ncbi:hypothetical protein FLP41_15865 [Paracoccus marcusii]|uniref:hypothetical protein n=1 Tax=Paracoccus marcusii TaxID=59779 RepID=UPI002ED63EA7|nr:hypothetical protein FLP41_15865 [Paracoccus marcusii]
MSIIARRCGISRPERSKINKGPYADGSIDKFERRIRSKISNSRLDFIFGEKAKAATLEQVLEQFTGYEAEGGSNVTIIDLSGIPFELLSITVSLISRLMFDFVTMPGASKAKQSNRSSWCMRKHTNTHQRAVLPATRLP